MLSWLSLFQCAHRPARLRLSALASTAFTVSLSVSAWVADAIEVRNKSKAVDSAESVPGIVSRTIAGLDL